MLAPTSAPMLVRKLIDEQLDMVNGARETEIEAAYRPGHRFGNKLLTTGGGALEPEIDPRVIISHRLPLEEAPAGYWNFRHNQDDWTKVVLKPGM